MPQDFSLNQTPVSRKAIDYYNSIENITIRRYYYGNPAELEAVSRQEGRTNIC